MKCSKKIMGIVAGVLITGLVIATYPAFAANPAVPADQGRPGFGAGRGPECGPRMMMQSFGPMQENLSQFLGIDAAKLRSERQSGKSLVQIAKDTGKSEEDLTNFMVSQHKARLDQLVKDGVLTKEQAAEREAFMKERMKAHISRDGFGPGAGGCGMWGGGPGRGFRGPQQIQK